MFGRKSSVGSTGEDFVCNYLKDKGIEIIARNYRNRLGEIDIIARDSDYICFVEVKTRTGSSAGFPAESVNRAKQRKISQTACAYLKQKRLETANCRFDVAAVMLNKELKLEDIEYLENAFYLNEKYAY